MLREIDILFEIDFLIGNSFYFLFNLFPIRNPFHVKLRILSPYSNRNSK